MPQYRITEGWSDPIALQARDMVQNQGAFLMEICPQDPGADPTSLRLPEVTGAVQVDAVTAMQNPDTAVQARQNVYQQQTGQQALEAKIAENRVTSLSDFLGRLHPVAAHFPIALLLIAALAELLLFLRPTLGLDTTVRFLVAGGAIGALVAALLGWFAAGWRLQDRSETLGLHRWNGTAIAGLALIAAWLAFRARNRSGLRIVLAVLAFAMIFQGYLGGEMVFGPNHLGLE